MWSLAVQGSNRASTSKSWAAILSLLRQFAADATVSSESAVVTSTAEKDEAAIIKGILARVLPDASSSSNTSDERLRFGDLAATTELVESLQSSAAAKDPLHDLSAWLASNYPKYDTRPKSPFYDWKTWVLQHMPPEQARLFLALDTHMQNPRRRAAIMKRVQFELSRLWDWQHRREAQGLPLHPSQQEVEAAAADAGVQWRRHAARLMEEAHALEGRGAAALEAAVSAEHWQQLLAEAEAVLCQANAVRLKALAHSPAPDVRRTCVLQAIEQVLQKIVSEHQRAKAAAEAIEKLYGPGHTTSTSSDTAGSQQAGTAGNDSAASTLQQQAGTKRQLNSEEAETFNKALDQLQAALLSMQSTQQTLIDMVKQGIGEDVVLAAKPAATTAQPMGKKSEGAGDTIARLEAQTSGSEKGGLLAFMREAERASRRDFSAEQIQYLTSLGLNEEQQAFLKNLHRSASTRVSSTGSASSSSTAALLDELLTELKSASSGLRSKRRLTRGDRFDRVTDRLQADLLQRKAGAAQPGRAASTQAPMYASGRAASSGTTAAGGTLLDARILAALTQQPSSSAQGGADDAQRSSRNRLLASSTTPTTESSLDWGTLPLFTQGSHQASPHTEGMMDVQQQLTTPQDLDDMLLNLGAPSPFSINDLHRQPYTLDLRVRPPTYFLDLVTDYMQVKYQDVLARRDAVTRMEEMVLADSSMGGTSIGQRQQLSPQEVMEINRQATKLFDAGDTVGYTQLMTRLAEDNSISQSQLSDHVIAVHRRAGELMASASDSAVTRVSKTDTSVPPDAKTLLAALLHGTSSVPVTNEFSINSDNQPGALKSATEAAQSAWSQASAQGLVASKTFSASIRSALQKQMQRQSQPREYSNTIDQLVSAAAQASSWEQACRQWEEFLSLSGALPGSPTLADVIKVDSALRAARKASAAGSDDPTQSQRLQEAEQAASQLNAKLDRLYANYLSRTHALATFPSSHLSDSSQATTAISGSQQGHVPSDVSHHTATAAATFNAQLNVTDGGKLLSSFMSNVSVADVLRAHWDSVHKAYVRTAAVWSTAPAWEQLWSLTRTLQQTFTSSDSTPVPASGSLQASQTSLPQFNTVSGPPESTAASQSASKAVSDSTRSVTQKGQKSDVEDDTIKALTPDKPNRSRLQQATDDSSPAPASQIEQQHQQQEERWRAYIAAQDAIAAGSGQWHTGSATDMYLAPPYPGARPLLRFTQTLVLGPASGLSSTQGLAGRVEVAHENHPVAASKAGYGPRPVLLPDHPAAAKVELRVQVRDLADEVGLSDAGLQHLLRIAGPNRYQSSTGDLIIHGQQYASREENRRWCLERLHMLLQEAHSYQSQHTQTDFGARPSFLLTRPHVSNLLEHAS